MTKIIGRKKVESISFDHEVVRFLEDRCRKEGIKKSTFVNALVKKAVMKEHEFYRQLASYHSAEMFKYKTLSETSPDRPD